MIPPHLYHLDGIKLGVAASDLQKASYERSRLDAQGAYPILSLGHLAHETGATYRYLRGVVSRRRDPYRSIAIPKPSGAKRGISVPEPILMGVQRWILKNILGDLRGHPASYAYQPARSIVQCASKHCGAHWMIKMDLHNFFGEIAESSVYRVFRRLGYRKLVAFELARITTRARNVETTSVRRIQDYSVNAQGVLPQGAPTSGQLANAVAGRLDHFLQAFALRNELVYTRYSDDLVFSSHREFDRSFAQKVIREVSGQIRTAGFNVHRSKTRVVPPGARKIVLGLLIDDRLRLLPEQRRRIETHLRGCEKFGLAQHAAHRGFRSVFSFVDHLDGWIIFALGVERETALEWRSRFQAILEGVGLRTG